MALTAVDKMKINKFINSHAEGDIYYLDLCDTLAKKEKVSDVEFLDHFVNCVLNEFRKNEKFSEKYIRKLLSIVNAFLHWVAEAGSYVLEDTVEKMRNFGKYYDEYLERNNLEKDDELYNKYIVNILDYINEIAPKKEEESPSTKYLDRIDELEKYIEDLEKKYNALGKLHRKFEDNYDKQAERLDVLKGEKCTLEREGRAKEKEIKSLNGTIEKLKSQLINLEEDIKKREEENNGLLEYKSKYEDILKEVETVTKKLEEKITLENSVKAAEERKSLLESLIYQKLLISNASADELIKYIKKEGYQTSKEEVVSLISNISKAINVRKTLFTGSPSYKVVEPLILEDGTLDVNVPKGCKHYDILLVSDFHIKELDERFLSAYDKQMEYCTRNNISLVLNLGDFFHALGNKYLNYEHAMKNIELTREVIEKLPKGDNIYQGILGGNHDALLLKYGFDPISMLANEREDFINLGYTHATIALHGAGSLIGKFDIHHPDCYEFAIDIDNSGIDMTEMDNYLNRIYGRQNRKRSDSYIDILGHTHKSQFNFLDGYSFIPSFCEGGPKKGACHLRIYFDEETQIKYMVFMPLYMGTQLVKNNEIVYKKVLTK